MITLHFNPQYDTGVWAGEPAQDSSRIGESYIGPMGLLSLLEVRLGLTASDIPLHETLAVYMKAAKEAFGKNPKIFFNKSLTLSPLATAQELLRWRDELVLAGWSAATVAPGAMTTGARAILGGLAEVETLLPGGFRTMSDRWRIVLAALKEKAPLKGFNVIVHAPKIHLHPAYQAVLDGMSSCGIPVEYAYTERSPRVEIKHFRDSADACLWAVSQEGKDLLVCSDDQTLAAAQAALGLCQGGASASQAPQPVEHLFTSAMMLLKDGGDIEAFRDYLVAPSHPLDRYKKQDKVNLRWRLLRQIIWKHGFEGVEEIVTDHAGDDAAMLSAIRSWLPETEQPLTYKRVRSLCKNLSNWAQGCLSSIPKGDTHPYEGQWQAVADQCRAMEFQCRELGFDKMETIPVEAFMQALTVVSSPSAPGYQPASVGSASVVSSIERIAVPVKDVVWVDGAYSETSAPLTFLCQEDVRILSEVLPYVWLQKDALLLSDELFKAGLSHIEGTLTALCCDTFRGKAGERHPFFLKEGCKVHEMPFESIPEKMAEKCAAWPVNTVQETYSLDISGLSIPDHEGPTLLEGMFDQPFDWVARSVLGLYEEGESTLSIIEGLVAHDVIHQISLKAATSGGEVSADAFERVFRADYDTFFVSAVHRLGAELNLPENVLERDQLRTALQTVGLPKLVDVIRHSGLTIVGSEVKFKDVDIAEPGYEPLRINGSIDLLLKNAAGRYVILDFKWAGSTGRKRRESEIRKGTDYQLALYRKVAETGTPGITKGTVDAQAFFMLRTGDLFTTSDAFRDGNGAIEPLQPGARTIRMKYEETLQDICSKYTEIVCALRDGTVASGNLKTPYLHYAVLKGKLV